MAEMSPPAATGPRAVEVLRRVTINGLTVLVSGAPLGRAGAASATTKASRKSASHKAR